MFEYKTERIKVNEKNSEYLRKQSLYDLIPTSEDKIVFIGDSITAGTEWSELFQLVDFIIRGLSGGNSKGVLGRIDKIIDSKPSKLFIMIGVNNLHTVGNSKKLMENYSSIINKIKVILRKQRFMSKVFFLII